MGRGQGPRASGGKGGAWMGRGQGPRAGGERAGPGIGRGRGRGRGQALSSHHSFGRWVLLCSPLFHPGGWGSERFQFLPDVSAWLRSPLKQGHSRACGLSLGSSKCGRHGGLVRTAGSRAAPPAASGSASGQGPGFEGTELESMALDPGLPRTQGAPAHWAPGENEPTLPSRRKQPRGSQRPPPTPCRRQPANHTQGPGL